MHSTWVTKVKKDIPGEGLGVGGQACSVPAVVTRELYIQHQAAVKGSSSYKNNLQARQIRGPSTRKSLPSATDSAGTVEEESNIRKRAAQPKCRIGEDGSAQEGKISEDSVTTSRLLKALKDKTEKLSTMEMQRGGHSHGRAGIDEESARAHLSGQVGGGGLLAEGACKRNTYLSKGNLRFVCSTATRASTSLGTSATAWGTLPVEQNHQRYYGHRG